MSPFYVHMNFFNSNITPVAPQHLSSLLVEHSMQIPLHNSEPLQLQCKWRKRCNLQVRAWLGFATHTFPGKKFNLKSREMGMSSPRICKDITLGPKTFDNLLNSVERGEVGGSHHLHIGTVRHNKIREKCWTRSLDECDIDGMWCITFRSFGRMSVTNWTPKWEKFWSMKCHQMLQERHRNTLKKATK